jgi:hypothetical protein
MRDFPRKLWFWTIARSAIHVRWRMHPLSGTGGLTQILVRAEQPSYGKKKRPRNLLDGRFSLSLLGF